MSITSHDSLETLCKRFEKAEPIIANILRCVFYSTS